MNQTSLQQNKKAAGSRGGPNARSTSTVYPVQRVPHTHRPKLPPHQARRRRELLRYLAGQCDAAGKLIWSTAHVRALAARGLSDFDVRFELEALAGNGLVSYRRVGGLTILGLAPAGDWRGR